MTPPVIHAIDPGSGSGALVTLNGPNITVAKLPGPPAFLFKAIRECTTVSPDALWFVEDVGKSRRGNSSRSSDTFSRHRGHLEMAFVALGVAKRVTWVSPLEWMKHVDPSMSWPHGNESKIVTQRKDFFNEHAKGQFPRVRFPKYAADAVCIALFGRDRASNSR